MFGHFLALGVGLALGMFGGGGSLLSVAILSFVLGMPPQAAIAASLLVTGVSSVAALVAQRGSRLVSTRTGVAFGGAGMLGAFVGARLAALLPEAVLLTAFGVVMLLTSVAMFRRQPTSGDAGPQRANEEQPVRAARLGVLALGIGIVTGMLGAGGGVLIVPALVLRGRMPIKRAMATSLLVIALQSLAGFAGHLGRPSLDWSVVVPFTLVATLGSAVGAKLARRARPELLRRGFAGFLLLVAVVVVVRQLSQVVQPWSTRRHLSESRS